MNCKNILLYEYLSGTLTPEEAGKTGDHLDECEECREKFRIMLALDNPRMIDRGNRFLWFLRKGRQARIAAAGLVLALLVPVLYSYFLLTGSPAKPANLASSEPYPVVLLDTRRNSPKASITTGLLLYRQGKFREALAELEKYEKNSDAMFFAGISMYMLNDPVKALEQLNRVKSISPKWSIPADWYRAQCLLKLGKTEEATAILNTVAASENYYQQKALDLLREIDNQ